jgi:hypothetical protein
VALSSHALTTVAEVKTALGISGSDDDSLIERLINAASDRVERYCGRHFERDDAAEETIAGYGQHELRVLRTPINSITSITYDDGEIDTTYVTFDANAGLIFRAGGWAWTAHSTSDIVPAPIPLSERRLYVVTFSGGYVLPKDDGDPARDLPYDLEQAVIDLVSSDYLSRTRDLSVKSERLLSYSVSYHGESESDGMPASVRSVLERYRVLA